MGQQESKQKLDQITLSLNRIRKDVRSGRITANDVERIQEILKRYSQEIEGARNVRASSVYTVEQLIDITSKELDALKQEVNLDLAAVQSNSFSRASSKNFSKKEKRKSVKSITDSVQDIRQQVRSGKVQSQDYDKLQRELATYSQQLSDRKNNRTDVEAAQKLISSLSEELFKRQLEETGSQKRSSLKRSSLSEKKEPEPKKDPEPKKELPKIANKHATSTLDDIESKLETLTKDVKVAETNRDKSRLHFLSKSVQTLMTDLQMVNVNNQILNEQKKELLEKNLQRTYKDIDKIKRQIIEDSDLKYLAELAKKQTREKYLQDLDELQKSLMTVARNVTTQNFQAEKANFNLYKDKLNSIEDLDDEIRTKKAEVADVMQNTDSVFTRVEMEERLNQAEWRHFQYKIDLTKFEGTTEGDVYKKHRQYLQQLREYVNKVLEVNQKVEEKKKYVVYNIDNNIVALDQKAKENEDKLKEKEGEKVVEKKHEEEKVKQSKEETVKEEVVLRKPPQTAPKPSNKNLVDGLVATCRKIPTHCNPNETEQILSTLQEAKAILEQKLSLLLQSQVKINQPNIQLVKVKEKHIRSDESDGFVRENTEDKRQSAEEINHSNIQLVKVKEKHIRSEESYGFAQVTNTEDRRQSGEPDLLLVTVKEKRLQPVNNSLPPIKTQLDTIEKEVETLQIHIENSRYTKETQLYKDIKNKLESYKNQVTNMCRGDEKSGEGLVKYIDNVLLLLESNMPSRRSTTEDMLVDIMSVSTRVNDLGSKIQNFGTGQDYDSIKNSLLEHKHYLKSLQIAPSRANLHKSRDDILQQIDRHLTNLENVKKFENNTVSEEEKRFNQDFRKVKEKVYRYSGTYKNVLYKTIENDLDKYLVKADAVFKDTNVALKVKQDIQNTKMILEQRSTKEQQVSVKHEIRDTGSKELAEIRENVNTVRQALSKMEPLSKEELDKLDARLTLSILALDNIRDDHAREEKEKLYQEIHLHFQQIQELMLVRSALVPNPVQKELDQKQIIATTISTIERELEEVKPQILSFVGTETSPNFLHLDEVLVRGTLRLDELNLDQTSELFQAKMKLMREIQTYSDILDERINQTEEIEKLEKEVKVVLIKIDSFNGYFGDSEYTHLDEEIIRLKVNLGTLDVNQELLARKEACVKEVDACMRKLNEAAKNRSGSLAGTLV